VKIAKKQNERDDAIRKIVWDNMNLYLNIYDVSSLLRCHKSGLTPEILEQGLKISRSDATKLLSKLVRANLVASAPKLKQEANHFDESRNIATRLTLVAKA
jgi:DNA-binding MarR family transcriptional regulator